MDFPHDKQNRLRPWLEHKLDTGDCPGLEWINKEERIFKIPWVHDRDATDEQKPIVFKVFVDWAIFTGKHQEGKKLHYPGFKHNFRCNLNKLKQHFEKVLDRSESKEDPYIVYRFVSPLTGPQMRSPCGKNHNNLNIFEGIVGDNFLPEAVRNLAAEHRNELGNGSQNHMLGMHGAAAIPDQTQFLPHADGSVNSFLYPDLLASPMPNGPDLNPAASSDLLNVSDEHYNGPLQSSSAMASEFPPALSIYDDTNCTDMNVNPFLGDLESLDLTDLIPLQEAKALPLSGLSSLHTPETSLELGALCQTSHAASATPLVQESHKMGLKIFYGQPRIEMMQETVNENGCRLYFGGNDLAKSQYHSKMYGPKEVTEIQMPIVDQCVTQIKERQRELIWNILKEMERGFILTFHDGDIYAQRRCRSRVYFCDANYHSKCLDRKSSSPEKVFDFCNFQIKLKEWYDSPDRNAKMPPAHFYLTIGVEVDTTNENGPMSKVMINVCVIHHIAEKMLNHAKTSDKRKNDSMQPFLSNPDNMDGLLELYKALNINPL